MIEPLLAMFAQAHRVGARGAPIAGVAGGMPLPALGAPAPPPSAQPFGSLFDFIRLQALMYEEALRIREVLLEDIVAPAEPSAGQPPGGALPSDAREDELVGVLRRVQLAMLKHPIVAQAAFTALIAEGRRFAETPEGTEWMAALAKSELLGRVRRVWDAVSLNMFEDNPRTIIPSAYLEGLLRAAKSMQLEELLSRLVAPSGTGQGDHDAAAR